MTTSRAQEKHWDLTLSKPSVNKQTWKTVKWISIHFTFVPEVFNKNTSITVRLFNKATAEGITIDLYL